MCSLLSPVYCFLLGHTHCLNLLLPDVTQRQRGKNECGGGEALVARYWKRKIEVLGEKRVPATLCPPQIPHGLTCVWIRTSVVRSLLSWEWPFHILAASALSNLSFVLCSIILRTGTVVQEIINLFLNILSYPACQWRTQEFFRGVQQIQLRAEDREDGDLGAVAP